MHFKITFTILTLLFLAVIGYVFVVPANVWRVTQACDGVAQRWVSSLTPASRVLEESNLATDQSGQRTLLAEPVYLEVTPPRPFTHAKVSLEVQNLPAGQKFGLGIVSPAEVFLPVLAKTTLGDLSADWQLANAEILLSDIRQTPTGAYKFIISAPGFTNRLRQLQIRHCIIEFSGWPTLHQLARRYILPLL